MADKRKEINIRYILNIRYLFILYLNKYCPTHQFHTDDLYTSLSEILPNYANKITRIIYNQLIHLIALALKFLSA